MITKMQVEHYQQKIKDMLKPQIEIVKLSLQNKRHKLVEETKKTLSKKMGIENKVKLLDKIDDDYEKMRLRHSKERDEMKLRHEKEDKIISCKSKNWIGKLKNSLRVNVKEIILQIVE